MTTEENCQLLDTGGYAFALRRSGATPGEFSEKRRLSRYQQAAVCTCTRTPVHGSFRAHCDYLRDVRGLDHQAAEGEAASAAANVSQKISYVNATRRLGHSKRPQSFLSDIFESRWMVGLSPIEYVTSDARHHLVLTGPARADVGSVVEPNIVW